MERFLGISEVALPVIVMIAIGAWARKTKFLSESGIEEIKSLIVKVCLPAVLFAAFYNMRFTWRESLTLGVFALMNLAAFTFGILVCALLKIKTPVAPFMCATIEGGSIGYALFMLLFGQNDLYHFALFDAGGAVTQWAVIISILQRRIKGKLRASELAKSLATPVNIAILAGILCSVTGFGQYLSSTRAGSIFEDVLNFVGAPVGPIIIMTVGYGLTFSNIEWSDTLKTVLARMLVFALFMGGIVYYIVGRMYPSDPLYRFGAVLYFIMPPTYAYSVFVNGKDESSFLSAYLALYTLITIVGYIVLASFVV
ncbi:AEC family transporter [Treponema socranskii]|uniref:AEC family transporter n=1 Tax=Treponema socranskii TaxID=53419 RepID=UPI002871EF4A|nr:hypothetical protein [Treponema socranskii]MDR9858572.1 hypothetical protein [Treponema socranskii]